MMMVTVTSATGNSGGHDYDALSFVLAGFLLYMNITLRRKSMFQLQSFLVFDCGMLDLRMLNKQEST